MIKYYVSVMEHREKIDPVASKVKAWMECSADEESINDSYWEDEVDRIYKEG